MSKYRIVKKVILHDSLTREQAEESLNILSEQEQGLEVEEYIEKKYYGLGRDPDLHKDD
jgi:hypothetical protein